MSDTDPRLAELGRWIQAQLQAAPIAIEPASADASFRRYFRLQHAGQTYIAMDAPPAQEDSRPYIDIAERLREAGLQAPAILAHDLERGFLLISDLGQDLYLQQLQPERAETLYGKALDALHCLQTQVDGKGLPSYDAALLAREMQLFADWFLHRHLNISLTGPQSWQWQHGCERLIDSALAQPQCVVHRDYHSRNLMLTATGEVGILDFQDAVIGPVTYDLVSLLRDCYIAWPAEQVYAWAQGYRRRLAGSRLSMAAEPFERAFDLMGLQRHLKAIGIFARLNHRDGKPGYLKDIPRTLEYVLQVSGKWPELAPLDSLLRTLDLRRRLGA